GEQAQDALSPEKDYERLRMSAGESGIRAPGYSPEAYRDLRAALGYDFANPQQVDAARASLASRLKQEMEERERQFRGPRSPDTAPQALRAAPTEAPEPAPSLPPRGEDDVN